MGLSAAELNKATVLRICGISSMISSSRAHRVLLVSPEYIIDDNEPAECVSAERAAAGRNLPPNWTVWFSFTPLSRLCCLTNTLTVNPSRAATSLEGLEGIFFFPFSLFLSC